MKKNSSRSAAFSLIELSIVILIIGTLIVGVAQSSILLSKMRIATAVSITQSSPVPSIPDLTAWYETTSEKSFDYKEAKDGSPITTWYDIASQSLTKFNATASGTGKPIYKAEGMNNLPTLKFDGVNDSFSISGLIERNSGFAIFIVEARNSNTSGTPFGGNSGITALGYDPNPSPGPAGTLVVLAGNGPSGSHWIYKFVPGGAYTSPIPRIWCFSNENYANGTLLDGGLGAVGTRGGFGTNYIGAGSGYYSGDIAEVIVYSRYITGEERKSVEAYLAKKWKIR